jgi:hypothetical protein
MPATAQARAKPSVEDKAAKFKSIAERRVSNVLKTLRNIGNLANRSSYDYSPEQIGKMFRTIRTELDTVEARFKRVDLKGPQGFTFD